MTIREKLVQANIPGIGEKVYYGTAHNKPTAPFLVYLGNGQRQILADDTIYTSLEQYQIEYYYEKKDPTREAAIEQALLDMGYIYEKSSDNYVSDIDMYLIYYYI